MNTRWRFRWVGAAGAAVAATTLVAASPVFAEYPDRPIRLIVPYAAGGGTDALARVIAEAVSTSIGQQLVVENNGSAGGNLATQQAASADPDGYTILMANQGPMVVNPHLFDTVTVDPLTAFDAVTLLARAPLVVAVPTESPYTSFKEVIDDAKARPGELTYGSAGNGSASHIATLLLADQAELDMVHIPYKGAGPAITDLIGGRLDFMVTTLPSIVGFLDGGKARALAVTTKERAESLPDVPTVAESGWPDYEAAAWYGFVVPTGTPSEIVQQLRQASIDAINTPEVRERLEAEGATPVGSEPQEFADYMKAESAFWKDLFDRTGIEMN